MKPNKIILITAGLFVLFGLIISGIAISKLYVSSLSDGHIQSYTITENISKIDISANKSDIHIVAENTDKITLSYYTDEFNQYYITTENGVLYMKDSLSESNKLKWYDYYFNIDFKENHDIFIKIPKSAVTDVQISAAYGEIEAAGLTGNVLNIMTNCGDIEISECKSASVECETNYGDIDIERCVSESIICNTDCGDLEVSDSAGNLSAHCDYGDIKMVRFSGSNITLSTDCGDIEGTILGNENDYSINAETELGDNNLQNKTNGNNTLNAKTSLGDISIKFVH